MSEHKLPNGKTLRRWTDQAGERWACMEYDHGPLCRRCQPVDDVLDALLDNVVDGHMEPRQHPDTAEFEFKMTALGKAKVEDMISSDPKAALIYAKAQTAPNPPLKGTDDR